jgi:hypothetical protein
MQRGRKSSESNRLLLALVPGQRPEPPAELTARQGEIRKSRLRRYGTIGSALKTGPF